MKTFNKKVYATKVEFKEHQDNLIKENMEELTKQMLDPSENGVAFESFEVVNIGNLVEVNAFYHETGERYNLVGYEVEVKSSFSKDKEPTTDKGFYPIWIGKCSSYAPISFEESYSDGHYSNGLGDSCRVTKVIREQSHTS